MTTQTEYYTTLVAAFIRGKLATTAVYEAHSHLFSRALAELSEEDMQALIQLAIQHELRLHRFKRTQVLARVRKVLGILKGLQAANLLDIGSGRGAFLWPLLSALPDLPITCVDLLDYRIADIQAVQAGGITKLSALQGDVTTLPYADKAFDVVTMLEVLEHVPATDQAIAEICRVANRCVILSVPSKADDNPEHIHLFDQASLQRYFNQQGVKHCNFDYVPGHMLVVARKEQQ